MTLSITVAGATLEPPTDDQLIALLRLASRPGNVLPADQEHFVTWLAGRTPAEIEADLGASLRAHRDLAARPGWTLDLAVFVDDEPIGVQSVSGFDLWPRRRVVGTASWLSVDHQRRGLGTRCRAAALELAFRHLGAESANSWALEANHGSIAVSMRLGYAVVDRHIVHENGVDLDEVVFRMTRARWLDSPARARYPARVTGAEPVVALLNH